MGDERYPERLVIIWEYENGDERNMPSEDTFGEMEELEELLVQSLDPNGFAILAFVFTSAGKREWHFYVADADIVAHEVNELLADMPELPIRFEAEHDPEWRVFAEVAGPDAS